MQAYAAPLCGIEPPAENSPNKDLIKYWHGERVLRQLFRPESPCDSVENVYTKVCLLNDLYSTNIYDTWTMASHIHNLVGLSEQIAQGDTEAIERIRRPKDRDFYSFTTKYCHHHQPEHFFIYDSFVGWLLHAYRKQEKEFATALNETLGFKLKRMGNCPHTLRHYPTFHSTLMCFIEFFELQSLPTREIDLFLWRYGKKVNPRSPAKA